MDSVNSPDLDSPDFSEHVPHDPLAGLAERAADNPGAPFEPDAIEALAELRAQNRAAFEQLRARLKAAKVRVTALDRAIFATAGGADERTTQADLLLEIAAAADLFHIGDKTAYADIVVAGRRETWPVRSKGFRRWLGRAYYEQHGGAPNNEAVQSALGVLEARAHYDAPERPIFLRVGAHGGAIYLDLGDETWRAIEIDENGWRIIHNPPARFRRAAGMLPLPEPRHGGSVNDLRALLNLRSDSDFILATAWLLAALRPTGPYPLTVLRGEQGSGKSLASRILRSLADPNSAGQRSLPRDDRDLFIAATNGHALSFDNVSNMPAWVSDTLCRLATGGGFACRTLYSDSDETLFDAMRPILLNGIEDVAGRADLAERSLFLTLSAIPETGRKTEAEINAALDVARPGIMGALLDAVSAGIRRLHETKLARLPRMADFAVWATACGDGILWPAGGFMAAYDGNRAAAVDDVIEGDPIASAIRALMTAEAAAGRAIWAGNAQTLLGALKNIAGEAAARSKGWPDTPRALSGRVVRAATALRSTGIEIVHRKTGDRKFFISAADWVGKTSPVPPVPPETAENRHFFEGDTARPTARTARPSGDEGDQSGDSADLPPAEKPQKSATSGGTGGTGAKIPTQSGAEKKHALMPGGDDALADFERRFAGAPDPEWLQ